MTEKGKKQIGISGNKANHADLTVELGFSSDLGVTNDRFPHEVGEGQGNMMGFAMTGAQVSTGRYGRCGFIPPDLGGYPPVGMWMILRFFKESNFSIKRNVIYAM